MHFKIQYLITHYDFLGRIISTQTPAVSNGWITTSNLYDGATDRLLRTTRTGEPDTLYLYNAMGEQIGQSQNGLIHLSETIYQTIEDNIWRVTKQSIVADGITNILTTTKEQLTGLADSVLLHTITTGTNGSTTTETVAFDSETHLQTTTRQTDNATPVIIITLYGKVVSESTLAEKRNNWFDNWGRIYGYAAYNPVTEQVIYNHWSELDIAGNPINQDTQYGAISVTGSRSYDMFGREVSMTDALGNAITNSYDTPGRLTLKTGATYPVSYAYDNIGRMKTLATTRDNTTWDTTRWHYDPATGLVTQKTYADNSSINYTYTSANKPLRTTWARGAWKENSYYQQGKWCVLQATCL